MHPFIRKTFVGAIVLLMTSALAVRSETGPLPPERSPVPEDQTSAPKIQSERSPCQLRLSEIAEFKPVPPITGPGGMQSNRRCQRQCSAVTGQVSGGLLSGRNAPVFDGRGSRALDP